jgi:uncharacterized protein (DUF488 family)
MINESKKIANCQHCNTQFYPLRTSGKFCSNKCKQAAYRTRSEEKDSRKLYTIGYEGKDISTFIEILKNNGIKHILDVRDTPGTAFRADMKENNIKYTLKREGIEYTSKKELGVVQTIRKAYKEGKMLTPEFEQKYNEKISAIDMNKLAREIKESGPTALMCGEVFAIGNEMKGKEKGKEKGKDKKKFIINCHRSILANILKETGEFDEIIHL